MKVSYYFRRLREYGVMKSLHIAYNRVEGLCFDLWYGIDTFGRVDIPQMEIASSADTKGHGYKCDSSPISALTELLRSLAIVEEDEFVDFGCGKGRALFVAARFPFKQVTGVEFARDLCATARSNRDKISSKIGAMRRIEICEADATCYPIGDEQTYFYWFNPFNEKIMKVVLDNICVSLAKRPRQMVLIFCHPTCSDLVDSYQQFGLARSCIVRGCQFRVYKSKASE